MPPKMKRPAASAPATAGKKRKSQDPIQIKCSVVASALSDAEELPENVRQMLASNVRDTLGVMKQDRHPFQEKVVGMIGETLSAVGARIARQIAEKEDELKDADSKKAALDAALESANKTLEEKTAVMKAKRDALAEATAALKANAAALKEAQKDETVGNKDLNATAAQKEELEGFKNGVFKELLERIATKQDLKTLGNITKTHGYDGDMVKALTSAFGKEPASRGTFDKLVSSQLDEQMAKTLQELNTTLQNGEPDKQARAARVASAFQVHQDSQDARQACSDALAQAQSDEAQAKHAASEANSAVTGFAPALELTKSSCSELQEALTEFNEGALAHFNELSVRAPEPEPAPAPEVATALGEGA